MKLITTIDLRFHTRHEWELLERVVFFSPARLEMMVVPSGFVTDGASIPWVAQLFIPKWHRHVAGPAILHDWLYSTECSAPINRKAADRIFYEALKAHGTKWWRRQAIYWSVRAFGGSRWKKTA